MPISGDVQLDANRQRFSLPSDSCVGDVAGLGPSDVVKDVPSGGKAAAQRPGPAFRFVGGPTPKASNWGRS